MATKYWVSTSSTSFSTAANWSDNAAPADNDVLIFGSYGTANCSTDLSNSGLQGLTIIVEPGYTGQIGALASGVASYLTIDGGTLKMPASPNVANASGSQRVWVDFGTTAATAVIEYSSNIGADSAFPAVLVKGTSLALYQTGGSVGVAARAGETATLTACRLTRGPKGSPYLVIGMAVTMSSCDAVFDDGTIYDLRADTYTCQSIRCSGATYIYTGGGALTTLHADSGTVTYSGTGTITTANIRGAVDFSKDARAKTVTTANVYAGASLNVDNGVPGGIVFTNAINYYDGLSAATVTTPKGVKATLAAI